MSSTLTADHTIVLFVNGNVGLATAFSVFNYAWCYHETFITLSLYQRFTWLFSNMLSSPAFKLLNKSVQYSFLTLTLFRASFFVSSFLLSIPYPSSTKMFFCNFRALTASRQSFLEADCRNQVERCDLEANMVVFLYLDSAGARRSWSPEHLRTTWKLWQQSPKHSAHPNASFRRALRLWCCSGRSVYRWHELWGPMITPQWPIRRSLNCSPTIVQVTSKFEIVMWFPHSTEWSLFPAGCRSQTLHRWKCQCFWLLTITWRSCTFQL